MLQSPDQTLLAMATISTIARGPCLKRSRFASGAICLTELDSATATYRFGVWGACLGKLQRVVPRFDVAPSRP